MFLRRASLIPSAIALVMLVATNAGATKLAGESFATGLGAKALGMGGAFVSIADDASAAYWNPAGLVQPEQRQILLMHSERFGNLIDHNCFSFAGPISRDSTEKSAGAISLLWLRVSDIALTSHLKTPNVDFKDLDGDGVWDPPHGDQPGEPRIWRPDRVLWDNDNQIEGLLSYARVLKPNLSVGLNAKVIWKEIANITCLGFGLDLGGLCRVTENLKIGVNIQDLTTTPLYWDGWYYAPVCDTSGCPVDKKKVSTKETIYPTVKLGASYALDLPPIAGTILLASDCDFRFEGLTKDEADFSFSEVSGDIRLGAMYDYRGIVHVSLGMDRMKATAGIGLNVSRFGVDYAFWRGTELDNTHRISVTMDF